MAKSKIAIIGDGKVSGALARGLGHSLRAIFFDELGGGLGNGTPWVELKDDLTASLL